MSAKLIEYEKFSKLFLYNPNTGLLYRIASSGGQAAGSQAGGIRKRSDGTPIVCVEIGCKCFHLHRIAWVLGNKKEIPYGMVIDHINGDPTDNRLSNLRVATDFINSQNKRAATSRSKSGLLGVCWDKRRCGWRAQIQLRGKNMTIGYFKTKEDGHAAYVEAKRRLHEGCTI